MYLVCIVILLFVALDETDTPKSLSPPVDTTRDLNPTPEAALPLLPIPPVLSSMPPKEALLVSWTMVAVAFCVDREDTCVAELPRLSQKRAELLK